MFELDKEKGRSRWRSRIVGCYSEHRGLTGTSPGLGSAGACSADHGVPYNVPSSIRISRNNCLISALTIGRRCSLEARRSGARVDMTSDVKQGAEHAEQASIRC